MLAFRVQLNDQEPVTGGAADLGVLSATITAVGRLGPNTHRERGDEEISVDVRLGGLTSRAPGVADEHLFWFDAHELRPGTRIVVEVIETESPDPALGGSAARERDEEHERAYTSKTAKRSTSNCGKSTKAMSNPSIERTSPKRLRHFGAVAHVKR